MTITESTPTGAAPTGELTPLLSLRKVNKSFGAVNVLREVDFDIFQGNVTALVGDNGAGVRRCQPPHSTTLSS